MSNSIYDEKIWPRILEKRPELKELAIEIGVENNPQKAKEIRNEYFKTNFGIDSDLSEKEQKFALRLDMVEFAEQRFLNMVVSRGRFAHSVGADEDTSASFKLVLEEFEWTFRDFIELCKKRNVDIKNMSFKEAYEIFLEVIQLKLEYKVPYSKLFVRKLLSMSNLKKEDSLEIKNYFLEADPIMLEEVSQELLL